MIGGGFVAAIGVGISLPTLIGSALGSSPRTAHGRVTGLWMSAVFLGQFLNPPAFALAERITGSLSTSIALLAILCSLCSVAQALVWRRTQPHAA